MYPLTTEHIQAVVPNPDPGAPRPLHTLHVILNKHKGFMIKLISSLIPTPGVGVSDKGDVQNVQC